MLFLIAFLWGFTEASFFFLIPDIILTYIWVFYGFKKSLKASFFALLGALLGGAVMYLLSIFYPIFIHNILLHIPLINEKMILTSQAGLVKNSFYDMILAPWKWIPYKIYAYEVWKLNLSFWQFIIFSIPARFIRFFLSLSLASLIWYLFKNNIQKYKKHWILLFIFVWFCIYWLYYIQVNKIYFK